MRVLVLNSGSSTLKFFYDPFVMSSGKTPSRGGGGRIRGTVDRIGGPAALSWETDGAGREQEARRILDHRQALAWVFERLGDVRVDAVGHRVVHGGSRFVASTPIDPGVIAEIEHLNDLAPLHNPACLAGIRASQAVLGPSVPMVAVFDTAFHRTLPDHAATYALPRELASKHRIRRYGFHGIAHASLADGYAALARRPLDEVRLIALHLGNGCSATAIRHGRSVDTSMGFTPLEGLVMGTRCGDLDASVVGFLAKREGAPLDDVDRWLNERSGLLGVSGLTHDMRELLIAAGQRHDAGAESAITLFCYRVRKYIGAYLAVLGGADAIVFGGGIGERSPEIRARICEGMDWCGLVLDQERNLKAREFPPGGGACISPDDAPLPAYVVAVDEETAIARETRRCLEGEDAS